jgi:phosphopantetheinyl transferase
VNLNDPNSVPPDEREKTTPPHLGDQWAKTARPGSGGKREVEKARSRDPLSPPFSRDGRELFELPFPAAIRFVPEEVARWLKAQLEGGGRPPILSELLSREEIKAWPPSKHLKRTFEWLLGRLAAKEAICQWIASARSVPLSLQEIEIITDERGKPMVNRSWPDPIDPPNISLSHVDEIALAIAGPASHAVGIDLERRNRINMDRDDFERMVNTPAERDQLRKAADWEEEAICYWTAKEAAAKALGFGFTVNPKELEVTRPAQPGREGLVRYKDRVLKGQWNRIGDFICAVAYG